MKSLAAKKVMRILRAHGFMPVRQRGSHIIFRHILSGVMVPVPLHAGAKPLPIGTFLAIIKQSRISKENFQ